MPVATGTQIRAAGASFGEIAHELGMSKAAISGRAKRLGWPPPEVVTAREAQAASRREWRQHIVGTDLRDNA